MKRVKLFHNPGAGDGDHSKEELISLMTSKGFECSYASVKDKNWKNIEPGIDFLVIAGGDGTVRKVVKMLLKRQMADGIWPLALLPLGTANNVASTLQLNDNSEKLIQSWQKDKRRKFDVGRLVGAGDATFFMESFGYGIFPYLIKEMSKRRKPVSETPEESMVATLRKLLELVTSYKPRNCRLKADGGDYSGKYILAEIMNTRAMGPNLFLAPQAEPGDGEFDIILVTESEREKFAAYIQQKIDKQEAVYHAQSIKAKRVTISWEGTHVHADDEVVEIGRAEEVKIEIKPGLLEFLIT